MQHMLTIINQTFKLEIINNFIRGRDGRLETVKLKERQSETLKRSQVWTVDSLFNIIHTVCLRGGGNGLCLMTWNTQCLICQKNALPLYTSLNLCTTKVITSQWPSLLLSSVSTSSVNPSLHEVHFLSLCVSHTHIQSRTNLHFSPTPLHHKEPNDCSDLERKCIKEKDEA